VLRLVDTNGDGVADGAPAVLASGLPGADSALAQAGPYVITTGSNGTISFLHTGATPSSPLSLSGTINFAFPSPWEHTTYGLAVRPAPGSPGDYNVFFNIGSQFNGIKKDANGNILYDANGVAIPDPTIGHPIASGLVSATLDGDAIYMVTLHDNGGTPVLSGLTKIATGLRNAEAMAIDPKTGDLLYADNGIDGTAGGNEAYSTDNLFRIPAANIGTTVPNDGFPYSYTLTNLLPDTPNTVINPALRVPSLASFQPLRDPNLPATGSESEGASGFAIAPPLFPAGVNQGVFVGFHGIFNSGGTANEENPLLYADPTTGKYFDFVSNDEPNIGHFDGATSTADSLFLTDIASNGQVFGSPGLGVIYQIQSRGLPNADGWQGYALDPQHTADSPVASDNLGAIKWQTPVDLAPQYSGNDLLIHYGSPLVTAANTVITPVKTGATGGFKIEALSPASGSVRWSVASDYALMPSSGASGYDWIPSYSPTLTPYNRLYFAGAGGTVLFTDSPDAAGPSAPTVGRLAFFGLSNYNANPAAYNSTVFINTPITSDAAGDIYFGFLVTGSNPLGLTSGIARIGADGTGSFAPVVSGTTQVATNSAPALSNDGTVLYVLESTGNFGSGKLVAMDSQTLAVQAQVALMDPHNTAQTAKISNDATASPAVGPDGDVYIGVLENPLGSNHDRGWLLHFSADLSQSKTPAAFGWDDTPSIVPASMVPSYHGPSTYLLMAKYNNYAGQGGDGVNKLAILDPNATMSDPVTGTTVMNVVLSIAGPTPDPDFISTHPNAVREWCINSAAVDPATDSVLAGSEDGKLYRWNLATNTFTEQVTLTTGIGEAYTPTLIGPDGTVYAINNGTLFATGGASASLVGSDTTTRGNWIGTYGSQGYDIVSGPTSLPLQVTVTPTGQLTYTYTTTSSDPRALQVPGTTNRVAAVWYSSTSFTVGVNLGDGQAHKLELYFLDWDNRGRGEQVQIKNAGTGQVLDTQSISSFTNGVYLNWTVSGSLLITITRTAGGNAVLNGVFLDPTIPPPPPGATAVFLKQDAATQGSWIGTYGTQGYDIVSGPMSLPAGDTVTPTGQLTYTYTTTSSDPRALQVAGSTNRVAAVWYSATSFTLGVNLGDGQAHNLELYFLDWDNRGRAEQIQLSDPKTGKVLDTQTISAFSAGIYLDWKVSGNLVITFTCQGPANAVLSGLFLDPTTPLPTATASFLKRDATTQGSWVGTYGLQGYDIVSGPTSLPSGDTVTPSGQLTYTWTTTSSDMRALQVPGSTNRIAAVWYSATSFTVGLNLGDGQTHNLELYFLDWDNKGRAEQIQLSDAGTSQVLNTQTISAFGNGIYLDWKVSGNLLITITRQGAANAVLNGLFLDSTVPPPPPGATASFLKQDATTHGSWIGTYGAQGYDIVSGPMSLPSGDTVTPSGQSTYTYTTTSSDQRALAIPGSTNRVAAVWYSPTMFTVGVNLGDGLAHNLELYFLDWDNLGRGETVQLSDAGTGKLLDTETISSFTGGVYLNWKVSGNLMITITTQAGPNAVVSGVFLDAAQSGVSLNALGVRSSIQTVSASNVSLAGAAIARGSSSALPIVPARGPVGGVLGALPDDDDSPAPAPGSSIHDLAIEQVSAHGMPGRVSRRSRN
jgi:hypothetical protein